MIVTLTLSPSIDRTITVDHLELGDLHRSTSTTDEAGGKGVNVARALAANGVEATAVFPAGGQTGAQLIDLLEQASLTVVTVPTDEPTRTNLTISEPSGRVTKINAAATHLPDETLDELLAVVAANCKPGDWVVASGRVPSNIHPDIYARFVARFKAEGCLVAVDTSGEPLRHAVAAGADLIKPNAAELEELVGRPLTTMGDVIEACRDTIGRHGVGAVVASLGERGAVYVDETTSLAASAPVERVVSDVGAGDSTLAGFLATEGRPAAERLATAVRWGAAAVSSPGSGVAAPETIDRVQATVTSQLDEALALT